MKKYRTLPDAVLSYPCGQTPFYGRFYKLSFLCEQPLTAESLNQSRQVGCEEILKGEAACANHEGVRGVKLLFETRQAAVHAAAAALHFPA